LTLLLSHVQTTLELGAHGWVLSLKTWRETCNAKVMDSKTRRVSGCQRSWAGSLRTTTSGSVDGEIESSWSRLCRWVRRAWGFLLDLCDGSQSSGAGAVSSDEHTGVRVKGKQDEYLLGETLSSALCLGADLGECSDEAGTLEPGGVVLVAIGGAEAARWARLERPWSRGTA
jgi:hypothetical protein